MSDLSHYKYEILNELKLKIDFPDIKYLYIFNEDYDRKVNNTSLIFITNNDIAYGFGNNSKGLLGLGHNKAVNEPNIIRQLSGKQIVDIKKSYNFMTARTKCGKIYKWGNGSSFGGFREPLIVSELFGYNVIDFNIENNDLIALTQTGVICAINSGYEFTLQTFDMNDFGNERVTSIACAYNHYLFLTESGKVYDLSYSTSSYHYKYKPSIIEAINSIKITKICNGTNNCLLLSSDGDIYAIYTNRQRWLWDEKCNNIPKKITDSKQFIDIACNPLTNISMALSLNGFVYVWGETVCGNIIEPKITDCHSFHDTIAVYCKQKTTYKMINFEEKNILVEKNSNALKESITNTNIKDMNEINATHGSIQSTITSNPLTTSSQPIVFGSKESINNLNFKESELNIEINNKSIAVSEKPFIENILIVSLKNAFNNSDPKASDLRLKIDDKFIYVSKWFLINRCQKFENILSKKSTENEFDIIEIKNYSYNSYHAFIQYLYTDYIHLKDVDEVIELFKIANNYSEEELIHKCVIKLEKVMSIENVCKLFSTAVEFGSQELENICIMFSKNKLNQIVKTQSYKDINSEHLRKFVEKTLE